MLSPPDDYSVESNKVDTLAETLSYVQGLSLTGGCMIVEDRVAALGVALSYA